MTLLDVAFKTLGCKLNQLETESIAGAFAEAGARIVPFESEALLYVVNTCTVTGKAEQKARRAIRQAMAASQRSVVLITGCYAQMEPGALSSLGSRVIVVPGDEKSMLVGLASWLHDNWQGHGDLFDAVLEWRTGAARSDRFAFHPDRFAFHSRPALKIQDGCNNRCSYCRVCLARGASVSLPWRQALERAQALEASGKAEIVLTGINLSQYRDPDEDLRFPELLTRLIEGTNSIRYRISSWEPDRVDDAFLKVAASPRVQPHFHLAVQSGSAATLRRMARGYGPEAVRLAARNLREVSRDPFIAADIIAGFPGETDEEFAETLALCGEIGFGWIHAFPFSPRPGTRAFTMTPRIPERVAGERVAALTRLAGEGKRAYVERWRGREAWAVLERDNQDDFDSEAANDTDAGFGAETDASRQATHISRAHHATTANYLKVLLPGVSSALHGSRPGDAIRIRFEAGPTPAGVDSLACILDENQC